MILKKKLKDVNVLLTLQQRDILTILYYSILKIDWGKKDIESVKNMNHSILSIDEESEKDIKSEKNMNHSILDIEEGEKEKLFSKEYETYFSVDDVLGLIANLETTLKHMNYNYLAFVDKLPEEEKNWKK